MGAQAGHPNEREKSENFMSDGKPSCVGNLVPVLLSLARSADCSSRWLARRDVGYKLLFVVDVAQDYCLLLFTGRRPIDDSTKHGKGIVDADANHRDVATQNTKIGFGIGSYGTNITTRGLNLALLRRSRVADDRLAIGDLNDLTTNWTGGRILGDSGRARSMIKAAIRVSPEEVFFAAPKRLASCTFLGSFERPRLEIDHRRQKGTSELFSTNRLLVPSYSPSLVNTHAIHFVGHTQNGKNDTYIFHNSTVDKDSSFRLILPARNTPLPTGITNFRGTLAVFDSTSSSTSKTSAITSSSYKDVALDGPLSANPPTNIAGTSYASTGFASSAGPDESGAALMAQGTILSGDDNIVDDEEDVNASLGVIDTIQQDEVGESSTSAAVVHRSSNPRFLSTSAYLGLPANHVVEGAEYVDHAWHQLMLEEAPNFEAFIDRALTYPAKDQSKSAVQAFPWKDCDDDILNKLDKSSRRIRGFSREIPHWLDIYRQETRFYVQYIRQTQALYLDLRTRLNRLHQSNIALAEERDAINHRLARVQGISALVGATRFRFMARVNEITALGSHQQMEARQLVEQLRRTRDEFNRVVSRALQLDSERDAAELQRVEEKRRKEERARLEEERKVMELMKLQSQKKVEEQALRQHKEAKACADRKSKDKGKGKAVASSPGLNPSCSIPFSGRFATYVVAGPSSAHLAGPFAPVAGPSSSAPNPDELAHHLSNLTFPQPQTMAEAGHLLALSSDSPPSDAPTRGPSTQPPSGNPARPSVPSWFPIFDAQQLVNLSGATPRARYDQLMVQYAELYTQAREGDAAAKQKYDEIEEAINLAMSQAHEDEQVWVKEEQRRDDEERRRAAEEAERQRRWNQMSFEEKRTLGYF
ncbi:hypothetical protein B0T20DRAFT_469542 [Sordaria brevicollis]|uniref:Uncharacterized protein n=1 Tax=Sordaria brevicollis TaxID=83679 RepID=A0AAE0PEK4_SORBR|nr:hypothetical protein B0T20DRAFT_469542 [Sordaria brevicollis]